MLVIKAIFFVLFRHVLAMPDPLGSYEKRDIQGFYNTLSFDVVSFYEDFLSNRYAYLNSYKSFFLTHSFSAGSASAQFSAIVTYTDDSFTSLFSASPALATELATVAAEFPWYSSWVAQHPRATDTASGVPNSADRAVVVKGPLHLVIAVFTLVTVLFILSL